MSEPTPELAAQLVSELFVRDLARSLALYVALGFRVERADADFAVLRWGDGILFLAEHRDRGELPPMPMHVRVMVGDVDAAWRDALAAGATPARPPGDRPYGLRDCVVLDLDGFGIRFARLLS